MEVTKIKIYHREREDSKLKAFVDFTIDDSLVIKGAKIIEGKERLFLAMPCKQNKFGKDENIVYPINKETRDLFEDAILAKYNEEIETDND